MSIQVIDDITDYELRAWSVRGLLDHLNEWTSLDVGGTTVIKILEGIDWNDEPVDIGICEYCGEDDGEDIYVAVSRHGGYIWLTPLEEISDVDSEPLLIRKGIWERWHEEGHVNRSSDSLVDTTYGMLKFAWLGGAGWLRSYVGVSQGLEAFKFVSEEIESGAFLGMVRTLITRMDEQQDVPLVGRVIKDMEDSIVPHTAWFIEDGHPEWRAFGGQGGKTVLALGRNHFFVDDPLTNLRIE